MDGLSLGLNWYLNTNLTVNTEWVYNNRYDLPTTAVNGATTTEATRAASALACSCPSNPWA